MLAVGGDQRDCAGILDAVTQGLGEKPPKTIRSGTDTSAGLHRDHAFDGHRQVDHDAVALLTPMPRSALANLLTRESMSL